MEFVDKLLSKESEETLPIEIKCIVKIVTELANELKWEPAPIIGGIITLR